MSSNLPARPEKIGVIGSGTMGAGIAQVCLLAGFEVTLQDIKAEQVEAAQAQIARFIRRAAEKGQLPTGEAEGAISRLRVTTDLAEAAEDDPTWIIEAIYESLEAKRDLLSRLNELCPPTTRFASNTSGISISEIGRAGGRPAQTVGLHFFNPVPLMRLVEVIRGGETDDETLQGAIQLGERLGKTVVVCQDAPNFIVNRINRPVYLEAQRLLEEGVSAQAIDRVMVLGADFKMGPLQTSDLSGVNIGLTVTENIFRETGDPRYRPVGLVRRLVRAGQTGKRAGKGFYLYPPGADEPQPRQPDLALPRPPLPDRVAVLGDDYEALWWRGKLGQARITVTEPDETSELIIVSQTSDLAVLWRTVKNPQTVYAVTEPLRPLGEYQHQTAGRVVGLQCPLPFIHDKFFEVSLPLDTDPQAAGLVAGLLDRLDYKYVAVPETPAGIGRRIIAALVNEAAFALQEGLASVSDIDQAMKLGMNYGLGPFEYADQLGLDTVLETLDYLQSETGDPRFRPAILLRQMVRSGRLGLAAGRGFHDYSS